MPACAWYCTVSIQGILAEPGAFARVSASCIPGGVAESRQNLTVLVDDMLRMGSFSGEITASHIVRICAEKAC